MKMTIRSISTLGLLTLSTVAVAGCAYPGHGDRHHQGAESESSGMMQHDGSMMMDNMHNDMHGDMHQGHHDDQAFMQDHQRMMEDMHGMEMTGDADYDFVRGMIPHHQGAIDMAETLLAEGSDPELLALAEEIIQAQQDEIAEMEAWLAEYGDPQPDERADDIRAAYERVNNRMMREMNIEPSGDVNRDFVRGMIPHHAAAIDMAYILLRYSEDPELRALAEDVIEEQEREIRVMRAWLEG